jgi:hypothetical protein
MSHYTLDELITRWQNEQLTAEQAIGQILLWLREQERRRQEARRESGSDQVARGRAGEMG